MRPGGFHTACYWLLQKVKIALCTLLAVFLLAPLGWKCFPSQFTWLSDNVKPFVDASGDSINAALGAGIGLTELAIRLIGPPWLWVCIKEILVGFQRETFKKVEEGALADHQRVTLYRYQKFCLWPKGRGYWPWGRGCNPWSGWMIPVVRAGPEDAGTTVFLCSGAVGSDGVCSTAYCHQSGILEIGRDQLLPDITDASNEGDIAEYARLTFVSPEMVRARIKAGRPCAKYFLAHRVEVQSKRWGVLMIDCRVSSPDQPVRTAHKFSQIRDVLDHLLRNAR